MRFKSVNVKNFHGFEEISFNLNNKFTVFIGENATGKTTILDSIAVAIGGFLLGIDGVDSRNIRADEVRLKQIKLGKVITLEKQYPSVIGSIGILENEDIFWERSLNSKNGRTTRTGATDIINYAKNLQKKVANGEEVVLPAFAYHGTGRLWAHIKETDDSMFETGSRFLGYKNCLNPISDEKMFLKWFKKMTLIEIQEEIKIGQFQAVKSAIENFINGLELEENKIIEPKVMYNINSDELQITLEDGSRLPFSLLSDGYRNVIGMVADIAFRMAVLNPFLEEKAIEETTGIVLIDEIDLHLHPEWQRKIVDDFKRVFPNIQFVVTTHSPFIIQSLSQGELSNLDHMQDNATFKDYTNMSVEDITEDIMGVEMPQWSEKKKAMYNAAKEYYNALEEFKTCDELKVKELKNRMDELTKPFTNDVGFIAFLEQKRMVEELKKAKEPQ